MKKIIIAVVFLFSAYLSFAQTTPAKSTMAVKTVEKKKTTSVMKKDGTPDMRMKENKMKAKAMPAAGPLKKDSTPDMRYKANKKK